MASAPVAPPASQRAAAGSLAAWALTALAVAGFAAAFASLGGYLLDDTFISLAYARNLVEGHGLVYHAGERVEGYTNFLWTVMLALPAALPGGLVPLVKVMSAGLAIAAALATRRLARAVIPDAA